MFCFFLCKKNKNDGRHNRGGRHLFERLKLFCYTKLEWNQRVGVEVSWVEVGVGPIRF